MCSISLPLAESNSTGMKLCGFSNGGGGAGVVTDAHEKKRSNANRFIGAIVWLVGRRHTSLPDYFDLLRRSNFAIARYERKTERQSRCADQSIEWIAIDADLVGGENLLRSEIKRLIRRIAEKVVEKSAQRAVQVDSHGASEEGALPDHRCRNIQDRLSTFARLEMCRRFLT